MAAATFGLLVSAMFLTGALTSLIHLVAGGKWFLKRHTQVHLEYFGINGFIFTTHILTITLWEHFYNLSQRWWAADAFRIFNTALP